MNKFNFSFKPAHTRAPAGLHVTGKWKVLPSPLPAFKSVGQALMTHTPQKNIRSHIIKIRVNSNELSAIKKGQEYLLPPYGYAP